MGHISLTHILIGITNSFRHKPTRDTCFVYVIFYGTTLRLFSSNRLLPDFFIITAADVKCCEAVVQSCHDFISGLLYFFSSPSDKINVSSTFNVENWISLLKRKRQSIKFCIYMHHVLLGPVYLNELNILLK